jgi:predicted phage-related endonuclease
VTSNVQCNGTDNATSTLSTTYAPIQFNPKDRRTFIGGSDARVIMGNDEANLIQLWREKRGEAEPEDLSDNLMVQPGTSIIEIEESDAAEAPRHSARKAASLSSWL